MLSQTQGPNGDGGGARTYEENIYCSKLLTSVRDLFPSTFQSENLREADLRGRCSLLYLRNL